MQAAPDYKQLYEAQVVQVAELHGRLASLSQQLQELQRLVYGSKTEKFVPACSKDDVQLSLDMEVAPAQNSPLNNVQKITYTRLVKPSPSVNNHPGRMKLPEHLERKEILIEPDNMEGLRKIGEEITEELEYEPGKLYVNRFVRPRYVTADNTRVVIAEMIERPLPKAIAGPGLAGSDRY